MNLLDGNSKKFLDIYNELDDYMRKYLKEYKNKVQTKHAHSALISNMIMKNKIFRRFEKDLKSFADLRNTIVHNPDSQFADPIAEPHEYIVKEYENLRNSVMNPPNALDTIAIHANNIYITKMDANALEVMSEMNKHIFTHVPVIENDKLVGVFSENTIFSYIVHNQEGIIPGETLINEFIDFIPLNNHGSECFEFVPRNTLVIEIEEIFQNGLKDNKRISVIFITQNGKKDEKPLGLITAWDLAGYLDN